MRAQVGTGKVLLGLSGGVDSSVVAALLHRAIGDQLVCVFVDHGLLRLGEGDQVMRTFAEHLGVRVIRVDAEARFLAALAGVTDPEAKRKIIGRMFVEVFDEEAHKLAGVSFLAQGTIYPDVIESAGARTGKAHVIKSHHNVGGLPEKMNLQLVEPLRELFKDEVRELGRRARPAARDGLPPPVPGPGPRRAHPRRGAQGVRATCCAAPMPSSSRSCAATTCTTASRRRSRCSCRCARSASWATAAATTYVIALRAVETVDFMTAHWARLPYEFLDHVSRRIVNEVPGISRVVYDISGKPPATIEWE